MDNDPVEEKKNNEDTVKPNYQEYIKQTLTYIIIYIIIYSFYLGSIFVYIAKLSELGIFKRIDKNYYEGTNNANMQTKDACTPNKNPAVNTNCDSNYKVLNIMNQRSKWNILPTGTIEKSIWKMAKFDCEAFILALNNNKLNTTLTPYNDPKNGGSFNAYYLSKVLINSEWYTFYLISLIGSVCSTIYSFCGKRDWVVLLFSYFTAPLILTLIYMAVSFIVVICSIVYSPTLFERQKREDGKCTWCAYSPPILPATGFFGNLWSFITRNFSRAWYIFVSVVLVIIWILIFLCTFSIVSAGLLIYCVSVLFYVKNPYEVSYTYMDYTKDKENPTIFHFKDKKIDGEVPKATFANYLGGMFNFNFTYFLFMISMVCISIGNTYLTNSIVSGIVIAVVILWYYGKYVSKVSSILPEKFRNKDSGDIMSVDELQTEHGEMNSSGDLDGSSDITPITKAHLEKMTDTLPKGTIVAEKHGNYIIPEGKGSTIQSPEMVSDTKPRGSEEAVTGAGGLEDTSMPSKITAVAENASDKQFSPVVEATNAHDVVNTRDIDEPSETTTMTSFNKSNSVLPSNSEVSGNGIELKSLPSKKVHKGGSISKQKSQKFPGLRALREFIDGQTSNYNKYSFV
jgi:hypothetical protein